MEPSRLTELQRYLAGAVRRTEALGAAPAEQRAEVTRLVSPSRRMTPFERLEVYREQYWYRHWANLAEDFPTVAWLLGGRAQLDALSSEFLTEVPPRTWNLQRLGEDLPGFVATHAPWRADPRVVDAARFDWAYVRAFDAADAPPFDPGTLAAIPAGVLPQARVALLPSLGLLRLQHAVHVTRRALVSGKAPVEPAPSPACVAVWRDRSHRLQDVEVEADAFALCSALAAGCPLGEACEQAARGLAAEDAARLEARIGDWFQEWTSRGWIAGVAVTPTALSAPGAGGS
jgi:hypothetical protein